MGSSAEGLRIAKLVQVALDDTCEVTTWSQGVFGLGGGTLESLVNTLREYDFAILVMTPDDLTESRGIQLQAPRDNVLLELGMFIGAIGRERTFAVYDRTSGIKLPSDLAGVTYATYQPHDSGNLEAALGAACTRLEEAINNLGLREAGDSQARVGPRTTVSMRFVDVVGTPSTPAPYGAQVGLKARITNTNSIPGSIVNFRIHYTDGAWKTVRKFIENSGEYPIVSCSHSVRGAEIISPQLPLRRRIHNSPILVSPGEVVEAFVDVFYNWSSEGEDADGSRHREVSLVLATSAQLEAVLSDGTSIMSVITVTEPTG